MNHQAAERVLLAVEQIPAGRVVAYGDVARIVGVGPRQVGAVLRERGHEVAWWRVVNAAGVLPAEILQRALPRWDAEGVPLASGGRGCAIRRCRADLERLASDYYAALLDWPAGSPA